MMLSIMLHQSVGEFTITELSLLCGIFTREKSSSRFMGAITKKKKKSNLENNVVNVLAHLSPVDWSKAL